MQTSTRILAICLFACVTTVVRAEVQSGPTVGDPVAALKVLRLTGNREYEELDCAAERADKTTVYIFIQAEHFDRPMARFLKVLDGVVTKQAVDAEVIAVWLTSDVDQAKTYLPRAAESLKFEHTRLAVHPGDAMGPSGWGINSDAFLTAAVVKGKKVTATFGFISLNETDVPKLEEALKAGDN